MSETALVWFRDDLRIHDHEALIEAATAEELLAVYCFDPRRFGPTEYGGENTFEFEKVGPYRARFRRESVADLRSSLRERGNDLLVRRGRAAETLSALVDRYDVDRVCFHTVAAPEERTIEQAVIEAIEAADVEAESYWGHTLYHRDDLPVAIEDVADTYTPFRKNVEANASLRDPLGVPEIPSPPASVESGAIPGRDALGIEAATYDERGVIAFEGGECAGLDRLETYVWERDRLREYKETRNGLLGADYSSKLSPWLNAGCLSPRRVHETVREYETERVENESTYWLRFELLWRDFFQFQVLKHGGQFFAPGGIRRRDDIEWRHETKPFRRWKAGETGIPFVDANMRELNETGYMSNRGRQNAASFLVNDCRLDWRWGAAYFETQLVDYDPCSNYGNWAYIAGVGNDSRDRYFDVLQQAKAYDGDTEYVKHWCPKLEPLSPEYAHEPWTMDADEQARYGVELGVDYPEPMLDIGASNERLE